MNGPDQASGAGLIRHKYKAQVTQGTRPKTKHSRHLGTQSTL